MKCTKEEENQKTEVTYQIDDLIVPMLKFPDPCPVKITITDKQITLQVGPRDWQWDKTDGYLVGCGTSCV